MKRRHFLKATGALAGLQALAPLTGCHRDPTPGKNGLIPIAVQADWYPQPEQGGFFNALARGFYKDLGLDVSILPLPAYGSGLQRVGNGSVEFCLSTTDTVLETVSHGLPFVAVGATLQHDPQAIMVHKDSPIHSFADLEGHSVAAQPAATWIRYVVRKYNLKNVREIPATHSTANFLADPDYIQQIFITSEPFFVTKAGATFRTLLISSSGYDPYRTYFTHRNLIDHHPDIVAKFVHASVHGWQDYIKDPGPANALILKLNPAQHPEQMQYTLKALIDGQFITGSDPSGAGVGKMDPARWTATYQQLLALGILRKPFDPATAYSLKFLS